MLKVAESVGVLHIQGTHRLHRVAAVLSTEESEELNAGLTSWKAYLLMTCYFPFLLDEKVASPAQDQDLCHPESHKPTVWT